MVYKVVNQVLWSRPLSLEFVNQLICELHVYLSWLIHFIGLLKIIGIYFQYHCASISLPVSFALFFHSSPLLCTAVCLTFHCKLQCNLSYIPVYKNVSLLLSTVLEEWYQAKFDFLPAVESMFDIHLLTLMCEYIVLFSVLVRAVLCRQCVVFRQSERVKSVQGLKLHCPFESYQAPS